MRNALPRPSRCLAVSTALAITACALSGCFMAYFPMLLLVPFMPLMRIAVTLAAKYGPLLLLLVEADPLVVPGETMIAFRPDNAPYCRLVDLETQMLCEVSASPSLRSVIVLEAGKLSPEWLALAAQRHAACGERLTMVFVDSRRFAGGARWSPATDALLRESGVRVRAGEGLAAAVAGPAVATLTYDVNPAGLGVPAHSSALLASVAACYDPAMAHEHVVP